MMFDTIILGSGPAGLTASIYTSRAGLKTLVIGGVMWGGQLMLTREVENFPGFENGILGPDLMVSIRNQAERCGAKLIFENATSVDFSSRPFKVNVGDTIYKSKTVIIATGASAKWLGLKSELRLRGRGVTVCATCDGPFFKNKNVIVVGGGDTAMEEALFLSKIVADVKVIHRRDKLRACNYLQEKAFNDPKISFVWSSKVTEILGKEKVEGVKLLNTVSGKESIFNCDAVFLAIGYTPNTDIFKDQIKLDQKGYILVNEESATNIDGVFAAGDVADNRYRQAVAAVGSGCRAALDAEKYLLKT
ncbi:MAG: thioredoxin-disulfide reductase [Candidatus Bathyarchaeota archaeon]|jgi:thioredoxin reductase (NADPH)